MQKTKTFFDEENFVEGIKNIGKYYLNKGPVMVVLPDEDAVEMVNSRNLGNDNTDFISLDNYICGDKSWRIQRDYKKIILFRPDQRYSRDAMGLDVEIRVKRTMKKPTDKKEETSNETI